MNQFEYNSIFCVEMLVIIMSFPPCGFDAKASQHLLFVFPKEGKLSEKESVEKENDIVKGKYEYPVGNLKPEWANTIFK